METARTVRFDVQPYTRESAGRDAPAELGSVAVVVAVGVAGVLLTTRGARGARAARLTILGVLGAVIVASGVAFAVRAPPPATPAERPRAPQTSTYVSSAACRACHPAEHASHARSFHRTMTQDADPRSVKARLGLSAELRGGREATLERRGEEIWARLPDPDAASPDDAAEVERRLVLVTGSHHEQAYWVAGRRPGELRLFPAVWVIREARFVDRRDAFLTPPDAPLARARWNSNCVACHAVAGEPGHDERSDAFDTRVADLGVTCEACHGPGGEHVARHRDPVERYAQRASGAADGTIVQPARLSPARSAAVCGQCHAYAFPRDAEAFWSTGYARAFRAGDALDPSRFLITPALLVGDRLGSSSRAGLDAPRIEAEIDSLYWPDGSIRVGGREYNGLVASPCFERGEGERTMTCLSCHAMHEGDPNGQISPRRVDDAACTQCHDDARSRGHAGHAEGTPGGACVDCHMPRTSYALFSAVRSHRIDAPSVDVHQATGKPNACTLCHLDRPLSWVSMQLAARWRVSSRVEPSSRGDVPEGVRLAFAGDAAQRVLMADAFGRAGASAGARALAPLVLAELARDPYAAVRFVAERQAREVREIEARGDVKRAPLDARMIEELRAARDDRPITIAE